MEDSFDNVTADTLDGDLPCDELSSAGCDTEDSRHLSKDIELKIASVLLKLENIFLVSSVAVNGILKELQYLISSCYQTD